MIHTVHGFHYWDDMGSIENRLFVWLERLAARFCDLLLSQNREDIAFAVHNASVHRTRFASWATGLTSPAFGRMS